MWVAKTSDKQPCWYEVFRRGISGSEPMEKALLAQYRRRWEVMVERHRAYGPSNIQASGMQGIVTRMQDKIARLRTNPEDRDAAIDLGNYADILALFVRGEWPRDERIEPRCPRCGREE